MEQKNSLKSENSVHIGLDWADQKHDYCLWKEGMVEPEYGSITHKPKDLSEWLTNLKTRFKGCKLRICLEQARGGLIYRLQEEPSLSLYVVNPVTVAKFRQALDGMLVKDDKRDAFIMMELLRKHREKLRVYEPMSSTALRIRLLAEQRRKFVDERKKLVNALRDCLKKFYPQVLELSGGRLERRIFCEFLLRWPTFQKLRRARTETIRDFYHEHNGRGKERIEKWIELIQSSQALVQDEVIVETYALEAECLVKQIMQLTETIEKYDHQLEEAYGKSPDAEIFSSFPAAGPVSAARLLAAFGEDRSRYKSALEIQEFSGVAPVIQSSGKQFRVTWRWASPVFLRQTFYEYSQQSLRKSVWARAYYNYHRSRGKDHHTILRALAYKWIRIMYRCWQNREVYDEERYLEVLRSKGVPHLDGTGASELSQAS